MADHGRVDRRRHPQGPRPRAGPLVTARSSGTRPHGIRHHPDRRKAAVTIELTARPIDGSVAGKTVLVTAPTASSDRTSSSRWLPTGPRARLQPLQLPRLLGLARRVRLAADVRAPVGGLARRHPRPRGRHGDRRGRRRRPAPGRADRHPVLLCRARSYVETNVIGTLNVLEAVRATARRAWSTPRPPRSTARPRRCRSLRSTRCAGQSPYSATKIAADKIASPTRCPSARR